MGTKENFITRKISDDKLKEGDAIRVGVESETSKIAGKEHTYLEVTRKQIQDAKNEMEYEKSLSRMPDKVLFQHRASVEVETARYENILRNSERSKSQSRKNMEECLSGLRVMKEKISREMQKRNKNGKWSLGLA
jgi:hypothetical protein